MFKFKTSGTCSKEILFDIVDNRITDITFVGGCDGNLSGISALVNGMDVDEVISRLQNIHCGNKATSCPDQLAKALEKYKIYSARLQSIES